MKNFVDSVRKGVKEKNWYLALMGALTLPDICGYIENPKAKSGPRYVEWFNKYLLHKYSNQHYTFLSGEDCYALRCALLHQGSDDIAHQNMQKALENFRFVIPPSNHNVLHNNQINDTLQLQVDIFCEDICLAVEAWDLDASKMSDYPSRMNTLLKIYKVNPLGIF